MQSDLIKLFPGEEERRDIENSIASFCREAIEKGEPGSSKHLKDILAKAQKLGQDGNITDLHVLFLVIKMYYEMNLLQQNAEKSKSISLFDRNGWIENGQDLVCSYGDNEKIETNKIAFKLKLDALSAFLFPFFCDYKFLFRYTQVDKNKFQIIILSMVINGCIHLGIEDEELKYFFNFWDTILVLLSEQGPDLQQQWWRLSSSYYGSHADIGESYSSLDSIKVRNSMIQAEWLKCFSKEEIDVQELVFRKKIAELQIVSKNQHPEWTKEECIRQAKGDMLDEKQKLQDLKTNSKWAEVLDYKKMIENVPPNDPRMQSYQHEAEQLFRIAAKLLHPDRRQYILNGKTLSQEHEEELDNLYNELISVRDDKTCEPFAIARGEFYSMNKLKRIVARAETTYLLQDIKLPKLRFAIMGMTVEEQIDFLLNEEHLLNLELAQIQAEIQLLYEDKDSYQKDCVVKDPQSIQVVKERFMKIIKEYGEQVELLQKEFESLFEEKG
jgi:hypothetical protein